MLELIIESNLLGGLSLVTVSLTQQEANKKKKNPTNYPYHHIILNEDSRDSYLTTP